MMLIHTVTSCRTPPTTMPYTMRTTMDARENARALSTLARMATAGGKGVARMSTSIFIPRSMATPIPNP